MKRLLFVTCLAACGGGTDDPATDGGTPTSDGGPPQMEPLINGKPASQYYAQFAHATTMTEVAGAAAFPEQPNGVNAFRVAFFLMPQNKLVLFYGEGSGTVSQTGYSLNLDPATYKRREGTWRVDGAALVLDSFMRCNGMQLNNKDALYCTLGQPIVTAAAQGRSGVWKNGFGAATPDDTEYADYTP